MLYTPGECLMLNNPGECLMLNNPDECLMLDTPGECEKKYPRVMSIVEYHRRTSNDWGNV